MDWLGVLIAIVPAVLHWGVVLGLGARIILKRRDIGSSLAWLTLVAAVPVIGASLYLLIGELWLARSRVRRARAAGEKFDELVGGLVPHAVACWKAERDVDRTLNAYASRSLRMPALTGNQLRLFRDANGTFDAIIADIDAAQETCHLLFFIWAAGGRTREVGEALKRAASRGVTCRVLLDAVGSRAFLSSEMARDMRRIGVEVEAALPVGRLRSLLSRIDLRNHRKIVAIDGRIGYCGSLNLADPAEFKKHAKVGQWIDVMVRVEGPTAMVLDLTMLHDWYVETGRVVMPRPRPSAERLLRGAAVQVISSGPGQTPRATQDMVLAMLYGAREEVIITTPYFIPGDVMMNALITAARCGVDVTIVLPAKVDSKLVRYASRAYFDDLLAEGVRVMLYRGGLLHAKTVTVDNTVAMLGSANMDRRSFSVNFETSLFIYDDFETGKVRLLQEEYMSDSEAIVGADWAMRSTGIRLVENATQLLSPLL